MSPLIFESPRERLLALRSLIQNQLAQLEIDRPGLSNQAPAAHPALSLRPAEHARPGNASQARLTLELNRIDAALTRNATGVYGVCSRCGQAMDSARLASDPAAALCMPCIETLATERLADTQWPKSQPWLAVHGSNDRAKLGQVFQGRVIKIEQAAAYLALPEGQHGRLQLCEVAEQPIGQLYEYLALGDIVPVKVIDIDGQGRISLSMKVSR